MCTSIMIVTHCQSSPHSCSLSILRVTTCPLCRMRNPSGSFKQSRERKEYKPEAQASEFDRIPLRCTRLCFGLALGDATYFRRTVARPIEKYVKAASLILAGS